MSTTSNRKEGPSPGWCWLVCFVPGVVQGHRRKILGRKCYDSYKALSKALGAKKPQEAQEAKALWPMKAVKDRREEFHDPARKDNILGRNWTRLELWGRAPQRPNCGPGQSPKVRGSAGLKLARGFVEARQQWHAIGWCRIWCYRCGKRSCGLFWMLGIVCVYAQSPRNGMFQGDSGRTASSSKCPHIRSTQERLCDDEFETRLKQNREVTEQCEDETKERKTSEEVNQQWWRRNENMKTSGEVWDQDKVSRTPRESAESNTSFWVRWRTQVFRHTWAGFGRVLPCSRQEGWRGTYVQCVEKNQRPRTTCADARSNSMQ